jgi:hypothetical protein
MKTWENTPNLPTTTALHISFSLSFCNRRAIESKRRGMKHTHKSISDNSRIVIPTMIYIYIY